MCCPRVDLCASETTTDKPPVCPNSPYERAFRGFTARIKAAREKNAPRQAKREAAARRVWLEDGAVVISPEQFEACLPSYVREDRPGEPAFYKLREIERGGKTGDLLGFSKALAFGMVRSYRLCKYHDYSAVLQHVVARCWVRRHSNRPLQLRPPAVGQDAEGVYEAYILTAVYNCVVDHARATRAGMPDPAVASLDLLPDPAPGPLLEAEWLEELSIVWAEIDRLPSHYREVLVLRLVDGRAWEEVADLMGFAGAGSAHALFQRSYQLLLRRLADRLGWLREQFRHNPESRAENEGPPAS